MLILITVYLGFTLLAIKGLFKKGDIKTVEQVAEENKWSVEETKGRLITIGFVVHLIFTILYIFTAYYIQDKLLYLLLSCRLIINYTYYAGQIKELNKGISNSQTGVMTKIYGLTCNIYIIYLLFV